ncbi:uncharacterized protein LOC121915561 [Sceloporus undulatus]|uniref:uncharacterized protein LOC121915561 n=1 Tax=Sceloporus undulatus TaxID=8520 RepID=UPI001C4DD152|nr:uncharacterized protein LOC121915561 [Sceloporus undulatus]
MSPFQIQWSEGLVAPLANPGWQHQASPGSEDAKGKPKPANPMQAKPVPAFVRPCLLASIVVMIFLQSHDVNGAPRRRCYLPKTPEHREAFRTIRNKYEDLRFNEVEPWNNCSEKYLQRPKMENLTKWEKLEALELELNLFIPVLQNQSEPTFSKETTQVLDFLLPYRENLKTCIQDKPPHHKESGYLSRFKEELQRFNTSNIEQSPKCLEEAVGLNIYSLLKDMTQVGPLHHHHGQHQRPAN